MLSHEQIIKGGIEEAFKCHRRIMNIVSYWLWQGPDSEEFSAASKLDDDVNFYQTANPNVAKLFNIAADAKRPAVVLLKKEAEKVTHFG